MIENIFTREELLGFSRKQSQDKVKKSVKKKDLQDALDDGWQFDKKNKKTVSVFKKKVRAKELESRVWTVLYRMGFEYMSGDGGAQLSISPDDDRSPKDQLDVVAIDGEVAVCVECKSYKSPKNDPRFPEKLARHAERRKKFAIAVRNLLPPEQKRHVGTVMFTWDLILRENDGKRAEEANVILFDEHDLQYFEALVKHLGPAARYQFLAEVFRGRVIAGLEVKVPALQTKMGDYICYSFSVKPEYLLKIGYVAHRAKGKAIDVDAYQRMIKKSRLKKIGAYISKGEIFPTNIVINIEEKRHIRFDRGKQHGDKTGAMFGWLTLSPSYGSAWIIDGQHRLFAYSGHDRSRSSYLNVLAFKGLPAHKHAQMFVDINSEQKRVKRSLLVELDATLKWDSPEDEKRIDAIISRVGMALDEDKDSPLRGRILPSDAKKTATRCVSLTSFTAALRKPGFFIAGKKKGVVDYGALWRPESNDALRRTLRVTKSWLRPISEAAREWWFLGAADGGGLAMNNGITVCINVLRSVLEHLERKHMSRLAMLDDDELVQLVTPYAGGIGNYLAKKSITERREFRDLQGADGQTTGTRESQEALQKIFPEFTPDGLQDWIERRKANYNEQAVKVIDSIETTLQEVILTKLKEEYTDAPDDWWFMGVPKSVRRKVDERINESNGKAGTREQNFDLIHYRSIIKENWAILGDMLGYETGNKDKRTEWIVQVGNMRNSVKHPSRREYLSLEKFNLLQSYNDWLEQQVQEYLR